MYNVHHKPGCTLSLLVTTYRAARVAGRLDKAKNARCKAMCISVCFPDQLFYNLSDLSNYFSLESSESTTIMARKAIDFTLPLCPSAKRPRQDRTPTPLSPSQVTPDPKATICAIVNSLSPHPSPNNYFQGEITDGETVLPLFGYDEDLQIKLKDYMETKETVTLRNCQVSENSKTGKL